MWNPDEQLKGMPGASSYNLGNWGGSTAYSRLFSQLGTPPTTSAGDIMSQWNKLGQIDTKEVSVPQTWGLDSNLGDMGKIAKGILTGNPLQGAEFGSGTLAKMTGKALGQGASAVFGGLKSAFMANPAGAVLGGISKIADIAGKTKQAKQMHKQFSNQIADVEESVVKAEDFNESQKELVEQGRDINLERQGNKLSNQKTTIDQKEVQAYLQSGGLQTVGDIDFSANQADENLKELAATIEQDATMQYDKGIAQADAQLEDFRDNAEKTIRQLRSQQNNLKTKWYQNIV